MSKKQYADRDVIQLDRDGNYYCRHVAAMTAEALHAKSDIAAELAWRDREIDRLKMQIAMSPPITPARTWRCTKRCPDDGGFYLDTQYARTVQEMTILRDQGYACEELR